ncbi:hypothetical protein BGW38_005928, partial [Lunasporangiospora selenospora]
NPVSREAKLKHILGYVAMQRELIVLEDDPYRTDDAGSWPQSGFGRKPTRNDPAATDGFIDSSAQNLHHRASSPPPLPPLPPPHQRHVRPPRHESHQVQTQQSRRTSQLISQPLSQQQQQQFPSQPAYHSQYQCQDEPDGLDPAMALPRALPRSSVRQEPAHPAHPSHQYPSHRQSIPRDSFYSGIGQENDWRHLEELDPDSLAGIHLYGDPAELQRLQQLSPAAASSPLVNVNASNGNNGLKYPIYEYSPTLASVRHPREHQPSNFRQVQYPEYDEADDEGVDEQDFEVDMALRQHRRHSQHMGQRRPPQSRQVISPAPNSIDREKKNNRFTSRFSFLTRRRVVQHQRHESMPAVPKEPWSGVDSNSGHTKVHSLTQRRSNGQLSGTMVVEDEGEGGYGATKPKGSNKVKKLLKGVFGISGKKKDHSPESSIRDISMPSTYHARASSAPPNQLHSNQETSIHSTNLYTPAAPPRRGLVTPVSRPGTSHSNYQNNNNSNSVKNTRRESLVDPSPNPRSYQELEDEDEMDLPRQSSYGNVHGHFVQTSLTPPPVSSVLRHSASSHRLFANQGHPVRSSQHQESELERSFIYGNATGRHSSSHIQDLKSAGLPTVSTVAAAVVPGAGRPKPRPVSQMVVLPSNNYRRSTNYGHVQQGISLKGNTSGEYDYTSTSNGTTLNNNSSSSHSNGNGNSNGNGGGYFSQFSQPQNPQRKHQRLPSFDYDRYESTMYDNGPTLVSKVQVQRVDLEGLRQDHSHHSHPHHLRMVPVEAPFA